MPDVLDEPVETVEPEETEETDEEPDALDPPPVERLGLPLELLPLELPLEPHRPPLEPPLEPHVLLPGLLTLWLAELLEPQLLEWLLPVDVRLEPQLLEWLELLEPLERLGLLKVLERLPPPLSRPARHSPGRARPAAAARAKIVRVFIAGISC